MNIIAGKILFIVGFILTIVTLIKWVQNPEFTSMQMLINYWHLYLIASTSLILSLIVLNMDNYFNIKK